jgi:diaminohydroxyphosphoribosylaminopyrimidine deaminase/5-amino-6-(5-phosphoribosylamino)uracil reductase
MNPETWLARALALAERGRRTTDPNPMVGCVIVKDGLMLGEGYHVRAGEPHAEIHALEAAAERARGAELYCTLEPCCHQGRTGPCTEAILAAGIRKVVLGAIDPNPVVSGRGVARLREAGVEVVTGVAEAACARLNEAYGLWIRIKRSFITLKLATTLDGRIAPGSGEDGWITGEAARRQVHALRASAGAVLVGARTVLADNPRLTARGVSLPGGQPARVVLDPDLRVPPGARVYEPSARRIVATASTDPEKSGLLLEAGVEVWHLPEPTGRVDLHAVAERLGEELILSVLVEGGGRLGASLVQARLCDKLEWFVAAALLGADAVPAIGALGLPGPLRVRLDRVEQLGDDVRLTAYPLDQVAEALGAGEAKCSQG